MKQFCYEAKHWHQHVSYVWMSVKVRERERERVVTDIMFSIYLQPPVPQKSGAVLQYEDENSFNECVNEPPNDESFHNPTPLYRIQGQSPYCHRPLPETPLERSGDRITG